MLWRIYLILETFQTTIEFPILIFIILIIEIFITLAYVELIVMSKIQLSFAK